MHIKNLITFSGILLTAIILAGCQQVNQQTNSTTDTDMIQEEQGADAAADTTLIDPTNSPDALTLEFTATESGQLAIDLLTATAQIETADYGDAGQFVTSINGLAADNQHYWAFYVNDEYAEQGVSQTELAEGDIIKFVYETVQENF